MHLLLWLFVLYKTRVPERKEHKFTSQFVCIMHDSIHVLLEND